MEQVVIPPAGQHSTGQAGQIAPENKAVVVVHIVDHGKVQPQMPLGHQGAHVPQLSQGGIHPLSPDHALDPAKVNASFQVAVQDDGPGSEIRAVLKDFLNILRRQGAGEPGFFPGVWYAVHKNPPPLFWIVFQVSGKKSVKTKFSCLPSRFNVLI